MRNLLRKLYLRVFGTSVAVDELRLAHHALHERLYALEHQADENRRQLAVRTVMEWIAHARLATQPLISVVLPTRDRSQLLARAIASIQAQTYANWELLVVDDGSLDDTPAMLAGHREPRLRALRTGGEGACAARNAALRDARGDLIAYLDDDNIMHPQWLKSVAWGFEQRPEKNVLYGAFVVDDPARIDGKGRGDLPRLCFGRYDHRGVATNNIADMSCIAHRTGLPEAHFDESLVEMGDWDLFLRLTRDAAPLSLPAIACFYTTDAANRLSLGPTHQADFARVRNKNTR